MELHAGAQSFAGVAADHQSGLVALLLIPLILWSGAALLRIWTAARLGWAVRLQSGWALSEPRVRITVTLLLSTAVIHLGLIPGHLSEAPQEALLFLANSVLFCGTAAAAALNLRAWRPAAAVLLAATVLAYAIYVARGVEQVDDLGVVTKLVELTALGLVLLPPARPDGTPVRRRVALTGVTASLLVLTLVTGAAAWGAGLRDGIGAQHQPVPGSPPSAAQRIAAQQFANATWTDALRYEDFKAALAAGYRPTTPTAQTTVHYLNARYQKEHPYMDPRRPQGLVYTGGSHPVLLGAMYELGGPNLSGNSFGGTITGWHLHQNICFSAFLDLAGFASPFGNCPPLSANFSTNPMLHVWRPENPKGMLGELDDGWARQVRATGLAG